VPRMSIRLLEPETPLTEIDLAGDTRIHHPLKSAVHRRPADAPIFFANEIDQVVGAEVSLLAEKRIDDEIALGGALSPGWAHAFDVAGWHAQMVY
jgi:hypothetical protein